MSAETLLDQSHDLLKQAYRQYGEIYADLMNGEISIKTADKRRRECNKLVKQSQELLLSAQKQRHEKTNETD